MTPLFLKLLITVKAIEFSKRSLLVIGKIVGLFFNTLTAGQKYSLLNKDKLTQPIEMQSSLKRKTISEFFSTFLKCR